MTKKKKSVAKKKILNRNTFIGIALIAVLAIVVLSYAFNQAPAKSFGSEGELGVAKPGTRTPDLRQDPINGIGSLCNDPRRDCVEEECYTRPVCSADKLTCDYFLITYGTSDGRNCKKRNLDLYPPSIDPYFCDGRGNCIECDGTHPCQSTRTCYCAPEDETAIYSKTVINECNNNECVPPSIQPIFGIFKRCSEGTVCIFNYSTSYDPNRYYTEDDCNSFLCKVPIGVD